MFAVSVRLRSELSSGLFYRTVQEYSVVIDPQMFRRYIYIDYIHIYIIYLFWGGEEGEGKSARCSLKQPRRAKKKQIPRTAWADYIQKLETHPRPIDIKLYTRLVTAMSELRKLKTPVQHC